jgi:outer membrane protein TolC
MQSTKRSRTYFVENLASRPPENSPGAYAPGSPTSLRRKRLVKALAAGGVLAAALSLLALSVAPCPADPPGTRKAMETSQRGASGPAQAAAAQLAPDEKLPAPRELAPDLAQEPPALPAPTKIYPIDLCTALRLAESENPTIGISRQAIQEALASQLRAKALLLPTLRAGTNYHLHNGVLQNSFGEMRVLNEASLYAGGGARALAAETVGIPMIQMFSPLADAFLEPLVARQFVAVQSARSAATSNRVLLEVASRFLELVSAEAEQVALHKTEIEMNQVVQLTAGFAKAGQGREADAHRARAEALLLHTEEQRAEERVAVASANLDEVLNLDTAVRLQTPAQATGLLQLMDLKNDPDIFVRQARAGRPELAAAAAEIGRRQAMLKQEQLRPFLPTISVAYSTGTFGGYTNRSDLVANTAFGQFGSRADFDVIAYWTAQNLGLGNVALQNQRRAQRDVATLEQIEMLNQVRREVVAAYGRAEAGLRRVDIARMQLETAEAGFREDLQRIRGGQGLPIEILNSVNRLASARQNIIRSLLEYNRGQFELFVAVGRPPAIACAPSAQTPK